MRKLFFLTFLACYLSNLGLLKAQISNKKITVQQQSNYLIELFNQTGGPARNLLLQEALGMSKHKSEEFKDMAARLYSDLGEQEKADEVDLLILKKFPKGKKAKSNAYEALFKEGVTSAADLERQYFEWVEKFSMQDAQQNKPALDERIADYLAIAYAKEDNVDKLQLLKPLFRNSRYYVLTMCTVATELLKFNHDALALEWLEEAAQEAEFSSQSTDKFVYNSSNARHKNEVNSILGEALLRNGQIDRAVTHLAMTYKILPNVDTAIRLAQAFAQQGKDLDAFLLLQNYFLNNLRTVELQNSLFALYEKLNNQKGSFDAYITSLDDKIKESILADIKPKMVKTLAPEISLEDVKGNIFQLSDLKGKIIILDFWATWCGPCKASFPGMQAAVDKYENDPEVMFLFVNTWETVANYRELVADFMKNNAYSFKVVFDEMKDSSKAAATAFNVTGIPTKIIIDKEGYVRFKTSGGPSDVSQLVLEMDARIELVKKG